MDDNGRTPDHGYAISSPMSRRLVKNRAIATQFTEQNIKKLRRGFRIPCHPLYWQLHSYHPPPPQLIFAFVLKYAKSKFSQSTAHIIIKKSMFIHSAMPVTNAKGMVNIVPFDISVQKLKLIAVKYHNDPKFSDRYVWANNADPDQTELHCLLFILLLLQTFLCCKANLL